jgi:glycosyltransferase involved in cell wall biosynthesis
MLAPWKGIHEIILWASMYESELKNIGIEEISIFGANIYHTSGEHNHYTEDINTLAKKVNSSLVVFRGQEKPSDIFNDIDLLIHYSLDAEPFGRVIIESFVNKVPVVSTALGGAGEMVEHNQTGFVVSKYDKQGLFEIVKLISQNKKLREEIVTKAFEKANFIESTVEQNMHRLFEERRSA